MNPIHVKRRWVDGFHSPIFIQPSNTNNHKQTLGGITPQMHSINPFRILPTSPSRFQSNPLIRLAPFLFLANGHGRSNTCIPEKLQNHVELPKYRNEYRTFCASSDLAAKKCVPCNSKDLRPMNVEVAKDFVSKVPGWDLINEEGKLKLSHTWKVKSFTKGLELFQAVANVAETEGHHPDLHLVGWNNVTIQIWTHAVGGVTENDFILASKISGLDIAHLLRRKAAS